MRSSHPKSPEPQSPQPQSPEAKSPETKSTNDRNRNGNNRNGNIENAEKTSNELSPISATTVDDVQDQVSVDGDIQDPLRAGADNPAIALGNPAIKLGTNNNGRSTRDRDDHNYDHRVWVTGDLETAIVSTVCNAIQRISGGVGQSGRSEPLSDATAQQRSDALRTMLFKLLDDANETVTELNLAACNSLLSDPSPNADRVESALVDIAMIGIAATRARETLQRIGTND
jgi:hypothetical protein